MNLENSDILTIAEEWYDKGRKIALATVISTWGSSPRPVGSQLIIDSNGNFEGSVSGGCIEGSVIEQAQLVIKTEQPKTLEFGVSDEEAWEVGLACGGTIKVLITLFGNPKYELLKTLNIRRKNEELVLHCINMNNGKQTLVDPDGSFIGEKLEPKDIEAAKEILSKKTSSIYETSNESFFLHSHLPPQHIIIIGATHITQSLCKMAKIIGYKVIVIDPRKGFATIERFADPVVINEWPDDYLKKMPLTTSSALVTLTHDPKIDDLALEIGIRSKAFYVGALGSKRTHAKRVKRLSEKGYSASEIERIKSPLGLDINAARSSEIALSALSEIVKEFKPDNIR